MIVTKLKINGIIAFLLVLLLVVGILSYQNASEYSKLKDAFKIEKKELESELSSVIKFYEDALYNKNNVSLNLREKLHKIIKLKDTISNLKTTDYRLFCFYRKRISNLTAQNKILFIQINSLNLKNNQLLTKNDSVKEVLIQQEYQNIKLKYKNRSLYREKRILKEKIAIAEIIDISFVKVKAMKKRRSGRHTTTSRADKTTAFKITFNLLENKVIRSGLKSIYIQIIYDNNVIIPAKKVKLKNNENILCNDVLTAQYNNKPLSIISFINVDNTNIHKGFYQINVFIEGVFISNTIIELK